MALGAAGVLALAGCSGSGDGSAPSPTGAASPTTVTATPSPTQTAEPSPTESSALPPLPDAAKENTPEGAEAFIRYYLDVANQLYLDPVPGLLPTLSDPDCESCASMEAQVYDMASNSQSAQTAAYEVQSMDRVGGSIDGVTAFNMVVDLPANAILDATGVPVSESEAALFSGEGAAVWQDGTWAMYGLNLHP